MGRCLKLALPWSSLSCLQARVIAKNFVVYVTLFVFAFAFLTYLILNFNWLFFLLQLSSFDLLKLYIHDVYARKFLWKWEASKVVLNNFVLRDRPLLFIQLIVIIRPFLTSQQAVIKSAGEWSFCHVSQVDQAVIVECWRICGHSLLDIGSRDPT